MNLTHISLFSGIGGMDLAADWAGFTTIAQVERDPYCLKILNKHWPNVPKFEDICDVTSNTLGGGSNTKPTVLSGGFPCQPFSTAGKRQGQADDRYLWPEMLRLVQELRPAWVLGENVAGILSMGIDIPISDLEGAGYSVRTFVIPAVSVGAPHRRDRVFIVAYPKGQRLEERGLPLRTEPEKSLHEFSSEDVADSVITGLEGTEQQRAHRTGTKERKTCTLGAASQCDFDGGTNWSVEPDVGRVANGIPSRVDRLRSLGNAVVPQQAYPFFAAIAAIERGAT